MRANYIRGTAEERFWPKVVIGEPDECWNWTGYVSPKGYGSFNGETGTIEAHRFAYISRNGAPPAGLVLDHLCRNTICCNPRHLEPVTHRVNILDRSMGVKAVAYRNGTCTKGHPKSRSVRHKDGRVAYCRDCRNENRRKANRGRA